MNLTNLKTGILVLLFVSILAISVGLYFVHKDVRNMKMAISVNSHDMSAIHNLLNNVGLMAGNNNGQKLETIPEEPENFNNDEEVEVEVEVDEEADEEADDETEKESGVDEDTTIPDEDVSEVIEVSGENGETNENILEEEDSSDSSDDE